MSVHAARAKFRLFSVLLAFIALTPAWASAAERLHRPFDGIVVFGDSLSDPGNAFALTGEHLTPPSYGMDTPLELLTLIPDAPYARGGNHFSNGPTWIEDLGRALGLAASVRPALRSPNGGASNYAVGGARARDDGESFHLSLQVTTFLRDAGPRVSPDALYVIAVGGNDVRDALVPGANAPLIIQGAVTAIGANVGRLYAAGARKFLIWNSPNLAVTPAVRALDTVSPGAAAGAQLLSVLFNADLAQAVAAAQGAGIDIVPFDAFTEISNIVANPAKFGLNDVTTACITPNVPPFQCRQPDRHLFWDGIHPTRAGHAIAALLVGKTLLVELLDD